MEIVDLIKTGGEFAGGGFLFVLGVWSGQYAKMFKPPWDDYASDGCLAVMALGLLYVCILCFFNVIDRAGARRLGDA